MGGNLVLFVNRSDAGKRLAQELFEYKDRDDVVVLALPRGGVPVAFEVAQALGAPLDIFLVRKLGVAGQEELAMGAIASGGVRVLNTEILQALHVSEREINDAVQRETHELQRREKEYRGDRPYLNLRDKTVILIDDGLATGASMRAAVEGVRIQQPVKVIVAVPTGSVEACQQMEQVADEVVCEQTPQPFYGVGMWYGDFTQISDQQVRELLEQSEERHARG